MQRGDVDLILVLKCFDLKLDLRGKLDDAEVLYEKLTRVLAAVYGETSPETLSAATRLEPT